TQTPGRAMRAGRLGARGPSATRGEASGGHAPAHARLVRSLSEANSLSMVDSSRGATPPWRHSEVRGMSSTSDVPAVRLTHTAKRAGCAAKHPPGYLLPLLAGLPEVTDPNVLVGSSTADDAAVIRLDDHRALVFTTDFFTPIVDDPYDFGQVAAANALSDVYAMVAPPLSALHLIRFTVSAPGT